MDTARVYVHKQRANGSSDDQECPSAFQGTVLSAGSLKHGILAHTINPHREQHAAAQQTFLSSMTAAPVTS